MASRRDADEYEQRGDYTRAADEWAALGEWARAVENWLRGETPFWGVEKLTKADRVVELTEFLDRLSREQRDLHEVLDVLARNIYLNEGTARTRLVVLRFLEANGYGRSEALLTEDAKLRKTGEASDLANWWEREGNFDEACRIWERLNAWVPCVSALLRAGRRQDAEEIVNGLSAGRLKDVPTYQGDDVRIWKEIDEAAIAGRVADAALLCEAVGCDETYSHYLERAGRLYQRLGNRDRAAALYRRAGRAAKADRVMGHHRYDHKEATDQFSRIKNRASSFNGLSDMIEIRSDDPPRDELLREIDEAVERGESVEVDLMKARRMCGTAGMGTWRGVVREMERKWRSAGQWQYAAGLYAFERDYDEVERVCREEDELDGAAVYFEKIGEAARAARIYQEIAKAHPVVPERESGRPTQCSCGQPLQSHWIKCPRCKKSLTATCDCGETLEPGWDECPACGKATG